MPINRRSVTLSGSTGTAMNKYTDDVKGDSYYGYTDGLHTMQIVYSNFVGRLHIQATLALTPAETDWFNVQVPGGISISTGGYKQFPQTGTDGFTGVEGYNIQGNFAWLRVKLDRSYIGDGTTYQADYGSVDSIRMSA